MAVAIGCLGPSGSESDGAGLLAPAGAEPAPGHSSSASNTHGGVSPRTPSTTCIGLSQAVLTGRDPEICRLPEHSRMQASGCACSAADYRRVILVRRAR